MMKTTVALFVLCAVVAPVRAASDADLARAAVAGVDVAALRQELAQGGAAPADVALVAKGLESLQSGAAQAAPDAGTQAQRAQVAALGHELTRRGVPEHLIHPLLWKIQARRFTPVDATPLFAQLRRMSLDPSAIEAMTRDKIRVFAKDRTDVAEAQYENISNSLYIPPDYLEPGVTPPRLKSQLSSTELNTVLHELDHAEKDLLTDDSEVYGKSLAGAMMGGVRKVGLLAVGSGFAGLALSAIPKLALVAPAVGLSVMAALVAGGAAYGAYQWYTSRNQNPRDARQQAALDAVTGIADVIRKDPKQKEAPGITEARSKAWEVSGYFMGDAVSDILDQVDTIKLEQLRRLHQAKTPAEVEAVVRTITLPDSLANRKFGDSTRGGDAWFRVKPVDFPYKDHPELFQQLYANSLGLHPPADTRELVARINADPTLFPALRDYVRAAADRRLKDLSAAGGASPAAPSSPRPVDRSGPNYQDVPVTR